MTRSNHQWQLLSVSSGSTHLYAVDLPGTAVADCDRSLNSRSVSCVQFKQSMSGHTTILKSHSYQTCPLRPNDLRSPSQSARLLAARRTSPSHRTEGRPLPERVSAQNTGNCVTYRRYSYGNTSSRRWSFLLEGLNDTARQKYFEMDFIRPPCCVLVGRVETVCAGTRKSLASLRRSQNLHLRPHALNVISCAAKADQRMRTEFGQAPKQEAKAQPTSKVRKIALRGSPLT